MLKYDDKYFKPGSSSIHCSIHLAGVDMLRRRKMLHPSNSNESFIRESISAAYVAQSCTKIKSSGHSIAGKWYRT